MKTIQLRKPVKFSIWARDMLFHTRSLSGLDSLERLRAAELEKSLSSKPRGSKYNKVLNLIADSPIWCNLTKLLRGAWFSRVWIVQEAVLARKVLFRCGYDQLSQPAGSTAQYYLGSERAYLQNIGSSAAVERNPRGQMRKVTTWRKSSRRQQRSPSLTELAAVGETFATSDPRNKLYALL